jgi:ribosome-binding ATPase YchF (GTP1/OBG family)
MCEPSNLANEKKVYLADWLSRAKDVQEAVPKVQQQLELAKWEEKTLSNVPKHASNILSNDIKLSLAEDLEAVRRELPEIPQIKLVALDASVATTSVTSTMIYNVTDQARHSNDIQIYDWGIKCSEQYETLQSLLGREQEVRKLLKNLSPKLEDEFNSAVDEYRATLASTSKQANVGIALRNVIEHYKGEIMNLARRYPNEQKLTWEEMANRIVNDFGFARQRFRQQGVKWDNLQQRLTKIAKGYIQLEENELRGVYTEFIDHLYIVLSLINKDNR